MVEKNCKRNGIDRKEIEIKDIKNWHNHFYIFNYDGSGVEFRWVEVEWRVRVNDNINLNMARYLRPNTNLANSNQIRSLTRQP